LSTIFFKKLQSNLTCELSNFMQRLDAKNITPWCQAQKYPIRNQDNIDR